MAAFSRDSSQVIFRYSSIRTLNKPTINGNISALTWSTQRPNFTNLSLRDISFGRGSPVKLDGPGTAKDSVRSRFSFFDPLLIVADHSSTTSSFCFLIWRMNKHLVRVESAIAIALNENGIWVVRKRRRESNFHLY